MDAIDAMQISIFSAQTKKIKNLIFLPGKWIDHIMV